MESIGNKARISIKTKTTALYNTMKILTNTQFITWCGKMADIARTIDIKHVKKLVANTEIVKTMYEISSNDEKLSYIIGCNEAKNDTAEMLNMRSNTFSATKILVVGDMEFLLLTEVEDLIVITK